MIRCRCQCAVVVVGVVVAGVKAQEAFIDNGKRNR